MEILFRLVECGKRKRNLQSNKNRHGNTKFYNAADNHLLSSLLGKMLRPTIHLHPCISTAPCTSRTVPPPPPPPPPPPFPPRLLPCANSSPPAYLVLKAITVPIATPKIRKYAMRGYKHVASSRESVNSCLEIPAIHTRNIPSVLVQISLQIGF